MKKLTKTLLLVLCAILLVAGSVLGTVAFLTDSKKVENTFTVGNVQIKLDEAVVDEETGKASDLKNRTEEGNEKVLMVPGRTIDKDPTVTVLEDSEACYVRAIVTVDVSASWNDSEATAAGMEFEDWASDFADDYLRHIENDTTVTDFNLVDWDLFKTIRDTKAKTITYILTYKTSDATNIVAKNTADNTVLPAIFNKVKVPQNLTNAQLALLQGMKIKVEAHAIQAEGFVEEGGKSAEQNAWMAFGG